MGIYKTSGRVGADLLIRIVEIGRQLDDDFIVVVGLDISLDLNVKSQLSILIDISIGSGYSVDHDHSVGQDRGYINIRQLLIDCILATIIGCYLNTLSSYCRSGWISKNHYRREN